MTIKNKMLLGALLLVTSAAWAAPATAGSTNTSGISKYELSWTYMGGAYVLISDTDGKIIKAYDGEIFYHR